jgi:uncharacterized protein (TIGR02246 family)
MFSAREESIMEIPERTEGAPDPARFRLFLRWKPGRARKSASGTLPFSPRLVALATVVLLAPIACTWAQAHPNGSAADQAAIRRVFADFDRSFNRHDARAMAMTFAPDADFTNMYGVYRRGREGVEQWMTPLFQGRLRDSRRTDAVRSIRFLTPNLAAVDANSVITGTRAADGSVAPPRKGLMTVILRKLDGRWRIAIFHEVEFPSTPPPPGK